MDFFTADWHLGHNNIIKYCDRPFKNTDEMDSVLINNVNEVAKPDDRVYNLGDVGMFRDTDRLRAYRQRIVCKNVFVILGNHDQRNKKDIARYFTVLPAEYEYTSDDGYRIILNHYAMRVWSSSHHGVVHLYGHSHGTLPPIPGMAAYDVGVDPRNYRPDSLDQVKAEMKRLCPEGKTLVGDHHGLDKIRDTIRNKISTAL